MTRQNALLTLGLSMSARENEIRSAWRKKAKFFHPDSPYGNVTAFLQAKACLLYTSPSPRDRTRSRMPSSA